MNIRVDLNCPIANGTEVVFRSPVDCSKVTGLIVYYQNDENTASKEFIFADAHGNNVGDIVHLFAKDAVVKVILDITQGKAFVQNADTNAYLEETFAKKVDKTDVEISLESKADKAAVQAELDKKANKSSVDTELSKKMNTGISGTVSVYYHPEETDETNLNAWLDNTVLPSMPDNSCKHIWIRCKAVDDLDTMGIVYKRTKDWAIVDLVSHINGHHMTKCRNEDWRNQGKDVWSKTVCNDSVFYVETEASTVYFSNTRSCKFCLVDVCLYADDAYYHTFAVDTSKLKDGVLKQYHFVVPWWDMYGEPVRTGCVLSVKKREANKDVAFTLKETGAGGAFASHITRIVGYC